jgi:D-serine deaminase-like pyridoxal phosphate-dependent protein
MNARPCSVRELNDQHAFVELPAGFDLRVGDWLSFGISHPCTAFDKWHLIPEVDDGYRIVDFIETCF